MDRRQTVAALASLAALLLPATPAAQAVQGSIAGRIPGVTGPDSEGYYLYTRPEGKSGEGARSNRARQGHPLAQSWQHCQRVLYTRPAAAAALAKLSRALGKETKREIDNTLPNTITLPRTLARNRHAYSAHCVVFAGGHGVGWSEIPRYSFRVPAGWDETPVSIADLGGTEIDLRYGKDDSGSAMVIVAPVLRFADIGYNADVRIDQLATPDRIIAGFAPELFGKPLGEDDVLAMKAIDKGGIPYYEFEVKPHHLVSVTAVRNRCFILATTSNSRQWRKAEAQLRRIQESFLVPDT